MNRPSGDQLRIPLSVNDRGTGASSTRSSDRCHCSQGPALEASRQSRISPSGDHRAGRTSSGKDRLRSPRSGCHTKAPSPRAPANIAEARDHCGRLRLSITRKASTPLRTSITYQSAVAATRSAIATWLPSRDHMAGPQDPVHLHITSTRLLRARATSFALTATIPLSSQATLEAGPSSGSESRAAPSRSYNRISPLSAPLIAATERPSEDHAGLAPGTLNLVSQDAVSTTCK